MNATTSGNRAGYANGTQRLRWWVASARRRFKDGWEIFVRNRLAVFGLFLLLIYAIMAVIHPLLMETVWTKGVYDPYVGFDPKVISNPSPPSAGHLLGTDTLGRDVLSILLAATTPTFLMAIAAALVTATVGTLIGATSAYFGGLVDGIFTHLADLSLLAPAPLMMVIVGFVWDITPLEFGLLYGVLSGLGGVAIVMRAQALTIVNKTYIEAVRVAGGKGIYIVLMHMLPHMLPLAAVHMLLTVTGAVFANGFVAFLGLSRARLNWGSMIYDSLTYRAINSQITWNVLIPAALAISLFASAFYLIARGLHEVAEPRIRPR